MRRRHVTPGQRNLDENIVYTDRVLARLNAEWERDKAAHPESFVWVLTRSVVHPSLLTPAVFRHADAAKRAAQSIEPVTVMWRHVEGDPTTWQSLPLEEPGIGQVWWMIDECRIEEGES